MAKTFQNVTKEAFSFLENRGFHIADDSTSCVQYEAGRVFVRIDWDRRSGEINVFVGIKPSSSRALDAFSLVDILEMEGLASEQKAPFQVADESKLPFFIGALATSVRLHASSALSGDLMYFRRLREFRNKKSQSLMLDMQLERLRSQAEKAWQDHRLEKVISTYQLMESNLTQLEKRKLKYALSHINDGK